MTLETAIQDQWQSIRRFGFLISVSFKILRVIYRA